MHGIIEGLREMVVIIVITIKIKSYEIGNYNGIAILEMKKLELRKVGTSQGR